MQAIINFLTVTPSESLLFIMAFGVIFIILGWFAEVVQVFKRIRYLTSESTRGLVTWHTWVWMPVRLFVIFMLPQALFQFFTEVLKFA